MLNEFEWIDYEDGSGSMKTKYGHSFFDYDKLTDEIKYPDGRYRSMSDNWRKEAEDEYMNKTLELETKYMDSLEKGIYRPYFMGRQFTRDLDESKYIAVDDKMMLPTPYFKNVLSDMRDAENRNFSDSTISIGKAVNMISHAIHNSDEKDKVVSLSFENDTFIIDKSKLKPIEGEERIGERELPDVTAEIDNGNDFEIG